MRRPENRNAFTIAELLIAIVVTLILVGILFRVFAAAAGQWQNADQRIDTFRDARAALQIMTRDLSRADINGNAQMLTLTDFFTVSPNPQFAKEAYAITPITNSGKSDLCTVGYYCAYDTVTHAYSLKRLFKSSDATYTSLATASPNFTAIFQKDTPTADEVAAAYVWDLQFHPGVGKNLVDAATTPSTQWNWMEIRFKSMSTASGRKIRNTPVDLSTWFDATSSLYKTFILPLRTTIRESRCAASKPVKQATSKASGFALVITLITIALLTIMAVAFLASSSLDQATARATANKSKADLAARTAVNTAIARLVDNISTYPDSATSWETVHGTTGTVLYYQDKTPEQGGASKFILPLESGGLPKPIASKATALPDPR